MNSTEDLKIFIDCIPDNVVIYRYEDGEFIFDAVNKNALQTEKITLDVIGKRLIDVYPSVKEFGLYALLEKAYRTGEPQELAMEYYKDNRIQGWRKNSIRKMPDGNIIVFYQNVDQTKYLENERDILHNIIDNSVNQLFIFDAKTLHFSYANLTALSMMGYTLQELKRLTPIDIKPNFTKKQFLNLLEPLIKHEEEYLVFETVHQRKDSSKYHVEIRLQLSTIEGKEQFIVFAHDISERMSYLRQLQQSEEKFKKITETSLMGIFIYKEKYLYANDAFLEMSGYTFEELKELPAWVFVEENYKEMVKSIVLRRLQGEEFPYVYNDVKFITKSGEARDMRVMSQTIEYENGYAGLGTIMDISDLQEAKENLKVLATTDSLTKIANRYKTNLEIDIEFLRTKRFGEPFSLIMIDIDHFKNINDTYGHDTGDMILATLADIISKEIREVDIFGRWGGEEFMLLLPNQRSGPALLVAQKLKHLVENYNFETIKNLTISLGVSQLEDLDDKETLLKRVDAALYMAKEQGRNLVVLQ